jgi:hypothetical protein
MTYTKYYELKLDALECADFDTYLAECGGSAPAECYIDNGGADKVVKLLKIIWDYAHNPTVNYLISLTELSQAKFAQHFHAPQKTVENWAQKVSPPFPYTLDWLAYVVIVEVMEEEF